MTLEDFDLRAHEMYATIPPQYLEGIDALVVKEKALPHPSLPDIYTLGECRTEHYPSDYGGPGEVRSFVVLFYGSFLHLSELDTEWDWEEELWETITHEVRHHLESLAVEDDLEVEDYVVDQNFARRAGEAFDSDFYRDGRLLQDGVYAVDGDIFVEHEVSTEELAARTVAFRYTGGDVVVPLPDPLGSVHFVALHGLPEGEGDVLLVLRRRRNLWGAFRTSFFGSSSDVLHSHAQVKAAEEVRHPPPDTL
jgi:hypothetical protein